MVLALVAYLAFKKGGPVFSKDEANFKVENIDKVTKIFLSDAGVGNIKLTKNDEGIWMVNDSLRARQDWVGFLLEGMSKQNASQMVPQASHNTMVKSLAGNSVKCEIFQGDKKTHSYFVGKDPSKNNLTVMLNIREDGTNAPRPFLVKCGHGGTFLGVRYGTEIENWRDKQILYFPKKEIKQIEVNYPNKAEASYKLVVNPELDIQPTLVDATINNLRLEKYVSFYSNLFCHGFENEYILKDTFVKAFSPFAQVKITSTKGQVKTLDVFYKQVNKTTHKIITIDGKDYDGDSFFGWLDDRDFILISAATVQKILRERQEFFTADST